MTIAEFGKARKGEHAHVFVCPPNWDYAFVTDDAYFRDELYDPITVKRQTWKLVEEVNVTFHPVHELCDECHGEGVVLVPVAGPDYFGNVDVDEVECPACDGTGDHPHAGQTEITAADA